MLSDQPLYRAGALEPIAGFTDAIFLVDAGGPVTKYRDQGYSAFFGIQSVRPIWGIGPHGLFIIWTQGAAPVGYAPLPAGVPTGNIAAGSPATFAAPVQLQLGSYQLVQLRWTMEVLALTGAVTLHDLDLTVQFGSITDFAVPQLVGRYNMIDQIQSPADSIVGPAQNANKALPAAFPQANPWDLAQLTETFWFENNPPTFIITNNGGAAITGGTIGLRLKGYRYMLLPLTPDNTWQPQFIAGAWRNAPPCRVVAVPTVPPTGTTTY